MQGLKIFQLLSDISNEEVNWVWFCYTEKCIIPSNCQQTTSVDINLHLLGVISVSYKILPLEPHCHLLNRQCQTVLSSMMLSIMRCLVQDNSLYRGHELLVWPRFLSWSDPDFFLTTRTAFLLCPPAPACVSGVAIHSGSSWLHPLEGSSVELTLEFSRVLHLLA